MPANATPPGLRACAPSTQRTAKGDAAKAPQTGADGKIHPMAIFDAIKAHADPITSPSPMAATC
jgi:hypothetical protein